MSPSGPTVLVEPMTGTETAYEKRVSDDSTGTTTVEYSLKGLTLEPKA